MQGRYTPLIGGPGDITDTFTSGAMTPSMRRQSTGFSGSHTIDVDRQLLRDHEHDEDEDDEGDGYYEADAVLDRQDARRGRRSKLLRAGGEKDELVPSVHSPMLPSARTGSGAGAAWRSVDGSRYRSGRNWSLRAKLLLLLILGGAVGGLAYFFLLRPTPSETFDDAEFEAWWNKFDWDAYVPAWLHRPSLANGTTDETNAGLYYEASTAGAKGESSWSSALDAILDRPTASATVGRLSRPTATAASKPLYDDYDSDYAEEAKRPSSASVVGQGRFADEVGEEVLRMAENGTLAAYKWHATLPALAASHSTNSEARLIVVGDIHGTHRSLVSLLSKLSYSTSRDTLLHTGDIVTKSSLNDSLRTLSLLRQYGARGVRGNNDQKVLEWRKWMEAYGPMPLRESSARKAADRPARAGAQKLVVGKKAPSPRRQRRSWLDWFTSDEQGSTDSGASSYEDDDRLIADLEKEDNTRTDVLAGEPTAVTLATRRRPLKPFGVPTERVAAAVATVATETAPDRSWGSRPTSMSSRLSSAAALATAEGGDLLGPEYAYLSPDLTASDRKKLGLVVPDGWEWGSEHFELARRLTAADVDYLESLPLTLWVEEVKSWVVHAGMVPWSSLRKAIARVSPSHGRKDHRLPELLESTSDLTFRPKSSLARQLAETSTQTALLLEQANADPYTLLNMRTVSHGRPSREWAVSSKGRKGNKGSRPWWNVWEKGMKACANRADEDEACEEAGVIYGHWSGQGLQVQDHSVGLDSGCVFGRQLSALVVPVGSAPSASPLGKTLAASAKAHSSGSPTSEGAVDSDELARESGTEYAASETQSLKDEEAEEPEWLDSATDAETTPKTTTTRPKSRPNWHGGLNRVKVPSDASAGTTSSEATLDETAESDVAHGSEDYEAAEDDTEDEQPWWRPWKRAPPQGRPGVAPWESAVVSLDKERASIRATATISAAYEEETSTGGKKLRTSSSDEDDNEDEDEEGVASSRVASKTTATSRSSSKSKSSVEVREKQVTLAQAPDVPAWVVSVDCAGELS